MLGDVASNHITGVERTKEAKQPAIQSRHTLGFLRQQADRRER
jgi:hypothetical protein